MISALAALGASTHWGEALSLVDGADRPQLAIRGTGYITCMLLAAVSVEDVADGRPSFSRARVGQKPLAWERLGGGTVLVPGTQHRACVSTLLIVLPRQQQESKV